MTKTEIEKAYTTGVYAAAAAAAVASALLTQKKIDTIEVSLPNNKKALIPVKIINITVKKATAGTIKVSNEINDATNNLVMRATAKPNDELIIKTAKGIGTVTKPGLQVKVGNPAINPVPSRMIVREIKKILKKHGKTGIEIELSVPNGKKIAAKTLNEKLGVVGGISILGTTGEMRPMSSQRWKKSLIPQIDIALAHGHKNIFIVPGNIGEQAAKRLFDLKNEQVIQASNFIGFMLKKSIQKGVNSVIILGHVGKLSKLAYGCMETHSHNEDKRFILLEKLLKSNKLENLSNQISGMKTLEQASSLLREKAPHILKIIADMAETNCKKYLGNQKFQLGIILINLEGEIISSSSGAQTVLGGKCLQWSE